MNLAAEPDVGASCPTMTFIVCDPDGTPFAAIPLDDPDDWNEAEKWAWLAAHNRKAAR